MSCCQRGKAREIGGTAPQLVESSEDISGTVWASQSGTDPRQLSLLYSRDVETVSGERGGRTSVENYVEGNGKITPGHHDHNARVCSGTELDKCVVM